MGVGSIAKDAQLPQRKIRQMQRISAVLHRNPDQPLEGVCRQPSRKPGLSNELILFSFRIRI